MNELRTLKDMKEKHKKYCGKIGGFDCIYCDTLKELKAEAFDMVRRIELLRIRAQQEQNMLNQLSQRIQEAESVQTSEKKTKSKEKK